MKTIFNDNRLLPELFITHNDFSDLKYVSGKQLNWLRDHYSTKTRLEVEMLQNLFWKRVETYEISLNLQNM